jgi:glycerol uptake facilitator-like aquaporin
MAKGAAIGAVAALPIPFIGPITGAIVGASIAAYTKLSKD